MLAIGTAETTAPTDALRPSLVTVMVVLPGATAVTTPLPETCATPVLSERYVTGRPFSTFPNASVICTVSDTTWPVTRESCAGDTTMPFTGRAVIVIAAVAVRPGENIVGVWGAFECGVGHD